MKLLGSVDIVLVDNIRELLDEHGMSMAELARRTGIRTDTIRNAMNLRCGLTIPKLRRIRSVLKCTWDRLLE